MASLTAATASMAALSVSDAAAGLAFTAEERAAFAAVKTALLGKDNGRGNGLAPGDVRAREVAVVTMVKCLSGSLSVAGVARDAPAPLRERPPRPIGLMISYGCENAFTIATSTECM